VPFCVKIAVSTCRASARGELTRASSSVVANLEVIVT
jgi:hypothetical protein